MRRRRTTPRLALHRRIERALQPAIEHQRPDHVASDLGPPQPAEPPWRRREPPAPAVALPAARQHHQVAHPGRLSRLTTTRGPGPKNGSATRNLPWRARTATRERGVRVDGPAGRRCHWESSAATVRSATVSAVSVLAVDFVKA